MLLKETKYAYVNKKDKYTQEMFCAILDFSPTKRIVIVDGCPVEINIPFHQIFIVKAIEVNGRFYIGYDYRSMFLASKKPLKSLDDIVQPIHYPHVMPDGKICQVYYGTDTFHEYVNRYIHEFWSANNKYYLDNAGMTINAPISKSNKIIKMLKFKQSLKSYLDINEKTEVFLNDL